jgi:HEAT repeat protein
VNDDYLPQVIMSEDHYHDRQRRLFAAKRNRDVAGLQAFLTDPDFRGIAASFLGRLHAREAIPHIVALLGDGDPIVRSRAATALGDLEASESLPALMEVARGDRENFVRSWAIDAIGRIGTDAANEPLTRLLREPDPMLAYVTAVALRRLKCTAAIEDIEEASRRAPLRWRWKIRREMRRLAKHRQTQ